jgi:hypothetical protein
MPEYDAFGREIGEDTLSGLTSEPVAHPFAPQSAPEQPPAPEPATSEPAARPAAPQPAREQPPAPEPAAAQPTFTAPTRRRRRGRAGALVALVILAILIAVPAFIVVGVVRTATDAVDSFQALVPDPEVPAIDEALTPAKPPAGLAGASLLRSANLDRALRRLRAAHLGRITNLAIRPERIDAQLAKGGRLRNAEIRADGTLAKGTPSGGGFHAATVPFAAIDPRAPERLVRRAAARYHRRVKGIDYVVVMPWPDEAHHVVAYFKGSTIVQGDRSGHVVRLISR